MGKIVFALLAFITFPGLWASDDLVKYSELPREVLSAVKINFEVVKVQTKSSLDAKTQFSGELDLLLETRPGFSVYEESYSVSTRNSGNWKLQLIEKAPVVSFFDPIKKLLVKGYQGQNVFRYSFESELFDASKKTPLLDLIVNFQACSKKNCLLPTKTLIEVPVAESKQGSESSAEKTKRSWSLLSAFQSAQEKRNFWLLSLFIFIAGLLTAFTPCVYPLFPITIGTFSQWSSDSQNRTFALSLLYVAGIMVSFIFLGLFTLFTGSVFGAITQTPLYYLILGLIFIFSALAFWGVINLQVPQFLLKIVSDNTQKKENQAPWKIYFHAFFLGGSLGLVASPCVGPVLFSLMGWLSGELAANKVSYASTVLLLGVYGLGLGFPFLVVAHFIVRLKTQVQLGRYTPYFKHLGGIALILVASFFLWKAYELNSGPKSHSIEFDFPVYSYSEAPENSWKIIDFRADWCVACLEIEEKLFLHPDVSQQIKQNWSYVQVDLSDSSDQQKREIARKYNVVTLPAVLFVNPNGKKCRESLHELEKISDFLKRLERIKSLCK